MAGTGFTQRKRAHPVSAIISNLFVKPDQFSALPDPVHLAVPMTAFCFRVSFGSSACIGSSTYIRPA